MKIAKLCLAATAAATLLYACEGNRAATPQQMPAAQIEKKLDASIDKDINSRSKIGITETLYYELISTKPEMLQLEDSLSSVWARTEEQAEVLASYRGKSQSYYHSAKNLAASLQDSVLKKALLALIQESESTFAKKTAELSTLSQLVAQNETRLRDSHRVLQIVSTLPLIEKYQDRHMPDAMPFRRILEDQEKQAERLRALTPPQPRLP